MNLTRCHFAVLSSRADKWRIHACSATMGLRSGSIARQGIVWNQIAASIMQKLWSSWEDMMDVLCLTECTSKYRQEIQILMKKLIKTCRNTVVGAES